MAEEIEGFDLSDKPSDGEVTCGDCPMDVSIPKGQPVYWRCTSIEEDEWEACCQAHAKERAAWCYTG